MTTILRSRNGLTLPQHSDHVQQVETHSKVRSRLFVNSDERLINTGYDDAQYQSGSSIMKAPVSKIGLESYKISTSYPNVNSRNDTITFFSNQSGINHTVVLDHAYYIIADLITEIQSKLNSVSGASLLTFTFTLFPGSTNTYELAVAGGSYNFLPSSHIDRAAPLSGLYVTDTTNQTQLIVAKGFYTRFIDVVCNELKDGVHMETLFTGENTISNSGFVERIHMDEYTEVGVNKLFVTKELKVPVINFSSFRSKQLRNISITLTDEFNDKLFSPNQSAGATTQNVKYVDYFFTFALE
tara:strand:+ start:306 stop:1199 length:894 start_codon:yes stop_codon:yes gene_type:complete